MTKHATASWLFSLLFVNGIAQNCGYGRYLQNIFPSAVSTDVVYGVSPALTAVYVAENVTVNQDMTMDIFVPVGDVLDKRPAVVLAYGGGYLFGTKNDEDVWSTCDSLAKKGYVTASINYRMNLNATDPNSAVRAIYRAAQDYSSAIRFLKHHADQYRIDTSYVFAGGVSAGGFSAMHMQYLDEDERPQATFQSGIFGAAPDLGCLDCAGNNYPESHHVRGLINLWGALIDANWIDSGEVVPMTMFHGTDDLIVPYNTGFPFTALFLMPEVSGSYKIQQHLTQLGQPQELNTFEGVGHNIWGVNVNNVLVPGPTEHWVPITDSIISFLYENIRPPMPLVSFPTSVCQGAPITLTVANVPQSGHVCWVTDASIISANSDSSTITLAWPDAGMGWVEVSTINHLEAVSVPVSSEIMVLPQPSAMLDVQGNVLSISGNGQMFAWYYNGQPILNETGPSITASQPGNYAVEVEANGCTVTLQTTLTSVGIAPQIQQQSTEIKPIDLLGRETQNTKLNRNVNGKLTIVLE